MKKLLSFILVFLLLAGLCAPALVFAAARTEGDKVVWQDGNTIFGV